MVRFKTQDWCMHVQLLTLLQEGTVTQLAHRAIEDYRLNKTDTINAVDLIQAQVIQYFLNGQD